MSFPTEAPFNPEVNKVPVLDASSGNPKSFQDPKSVASIGAKIQAMADQAKADTLYDTKSEGFTGHSDIPWMDSSTAIIIVLGIVLIFSSFS